MENRTDHKTIPPGSVADGDTVEFAIEDEYRRLVGVDTTYGPEREIQVQTKDGNVVSLVGPISGSVDVDMDVDLQKGDVLRVTYGADGTERGGVLEVRRDEPLPNRIADALKGVIGA